MNENLNSPKNFSEEEIVEARNKASKTLNAKIKGTISEIRGLTEEENAFIERISKAYKNATEKNGGIPTELTINDESEIKLYQQCVEKITSALLHRTLNYENPQRFFDFQYTLKILDVILKNSKLLEKEIGNRYGLLQESAWLIKNDSWGKKRKGSDETIPTKEDFIKNYIEVEEILRKHNLLDSINN